MKHFLRFLAASLLTGLGFTATAQQPTPQLINCATVPTPVPCNGVVKNTGTGDAPYIGGGKINANIQALFGGAGNFLFGSFTNAQVISSFSPGGSPGKSVLSSDMGLMTSDGTRWLSITPPAIPPGAATLGYSRNIYTVYPVIADITVPRTTAISRFYNGAITSGTIPPATAYALDSNGQLQLIYPQGGPGNQAGLLTTINSLPSQSVTGNLGFLPYLLAGKGFYIEEAVTMSASANASDCFNAFFLNPQEHNTLQADHKPGDPTTPVIYERWMEFDVNECGHGTDNGGAFRGAFLSWLGFFSYPLVFTAPPTGTSGTVTPVWPGDTLTLLWPVTFSDGEKRNVTMTQGSGAVSWSGALTGSPTVNATVTYARNASSSNTQVAPLDYSVEHIFGLSYDPVGQQVTFWLDDVQQSTVSTAIADTISNSWHYYPLLQMASHGAFTGTTMDVRYVSAWAP